MHIAVEPFPHEDHDCLNHFESPSKKHLETAKVALEGTILSDIILPHESLLIKTTSCSKCDCKYRVIIGRATQCVQNEDGVVYRAIVDYSEPLMESPF